MGRVEWRAVCVCEQTLVVVCLAGRGRVRRFDEWEVDRGGVRRGRWRERDGA